MMDLQEAIEISRAQVKEARATIKDMNHTIREYREVIREYREELTSLKEELSRELTRTTDERLEAFVGPSIDNLLDQLKQERNVWIEKTEKSLLSWKEESVKWGLSLSEREDKIVAEWVATWRVLFRRFPDLKPEWREELRKADASIKASRLTESPES